MPRPTDRRQAGASFGIIGTTGLSTPGPAASSRHPSQILPNTAHLLPRHVVPYPGASAFSAGAHQAVFLPLCFRVFRIVHGPLLLHGLGSSVPFARFPASVDEAAVRSIGHPSCCGRGEVTRCSPVQPGSLP